MTGNQTGGGSPQNSPSQAGAGNPGMANKVMADKDESEDIEDTEDEAEETEKNEQLSSDQDV